MPPILSPPPGHPGSIPIRRRSGRVRLEAELLGGFGDAVNEEILVLVVAVFAHDGAELAQLAIQDACDRIALERDDLVQPVGEQRDVGRERQGRTRDVRARVHGREVEDVRGRDQDLGQEGVHGNPEDQRETAEPDPLPLRPRERGNRAGEEQGERAVPRVAGPGVVLGHCAVGLVHDPCAHEGWARRVDPVPRVHAHAAVGGCAHIPALHAGLDVRPPQCAQPLGDAHPLGGRPGGERVGVRRARAHHRLQATQPAHPGGPRRRGHLRLVDPRPRVRRRQGAHRRAPGHDAGEGRLCIGEPWVRSDNVTRLSSDRICTDRRTVTLTGRIPVPTRPDNRAIEAPPETVDVPSLHGSEVLHRYRKSRRPSQARVQIDQCPPRASALDRSHHRGAASSRRARKHIGPLHQ